MTLSEALALEAAGKGSVRFFDGEPHWEAGEQPRFAAQPKDAGPTDPREAERVQRLVDLQNRSAELHRQLREVAKEKAVVAREGR